MDSYFEIKALPNAEILQTEVVAHLMQKLHGVLPSYEGRIGLDFPAYGQHNTLGGILRLLGLQADIQHIRDEISIDMQFTDYALITEVQTIPNNILHHRKYKRKQVKGQSDFARMKKRYQAKNQWTEALSEKIKHNYLAPITLPYVKLNSTSTQQKFLLFIQQHYTTKPELGRFNSYGLSLKNATVPKF
jgi:CRISPR-associated endonuclease Csy4